MTKYTWINTFDQETESIEAESFLVEGGRVTFFGLR